MARRICRVVAVGDAIVDRITPPMRPLPRGDFQGHIAAFETLPGGNATNFALQIARLGAKTTFVGVLGRDAVPIEHPTGCGDVCNAAYLNARFGGDSATEALRFPNACSPLHIRDRRHPYSRLSDVRRFLASRFTGS